MLPYLSSFCYIPPTSHVQLIFYETIERYDNEIRGPKEILIDNSHHVISTTEKIQICNFHCRNKEANLRDDLKWAINLYRSIKTENISIKNTADY